MMGKQNNKIFIRRGTLKISLFNVLFIAFLIYCFLFLFIFIFIVSEVLGGAGGVEGGRFIVTWRQTDVVMFRFQSKTPVEATTVRPLLSLPRCPGNNEKHFKAFEGAVFKIWWHL